jgi:hypothetical protein
MLKNQLYGDLIFPYLDSEGLYNASLSFRLPYGLKPHLAVLDHKSSMVLFVFLFCLRIY